MSPTFIARREARPEPVIPRQVAPTHERSKSTPEIEDRIFDKAEAASQLEAARRELSDAMDSVDELNGVRDASTGKHRERLEARIGREERRIDELTAKIDALAEAQAEG